VADGIAAITLFVEDVSVSKEFYARAFEAPVHFEDDVSVVFLFGATMINLLDIREAAELVEPAAVGRQAAGSRSLFTLTVDDVDAACARLADRGVALLNGPIDRPWGPRTAAFGDPDGYVWEFASA
jgi:catechol 2,3-dioxygenase-like lactoylglutathione lyase family enzyme